MKRLSLLLAIFFQSLLWAVISGVFLGFLFDLVLFGLAYFGIFGIALGFGAGIILGVINGLLLGVITIFGFYPVRNIRRYEIIVATVMCSVVFLSGVFFFYNVITPVVNPVSAIKLSSFASLWAGIATFFVNKKIINWYVVSYNGKVTTPTEQNTIER